MSKLFYLETRPRCVHLVIDVLRKRGLNTEAIEAEYIDYKRGMHGELIMWCEDDAYPAFVHRAQEDIIRKCGIKVEY